MRRLILLATLLLACTSTTAPKPATSPIGAEDAATPIGADDAAMPAVDSGTTAAAPRLPLPIPHPTMVAASATRRIVAIGDVHGDYESMRRVLILVGLIDDLDRWIGGDAILVQVGDQLDRGDQERRIIDELERLATEAHAAGGAVYPLLGNHETMNVSEDFRYVTLGGWSDFADVAHNTDDPALATYTSSERGRVAAFRPGGPYARILARHNVMMLVGATLFAHGGILPAHAQYGLEAINHETRQWILGATPRPAVLSGEDSPVWSRHYSSDTDDADCALLQDVLQRTGAVRIVVAHTVQSSGINSACDDKIWRVDVGLAAHYGGAPEALEIIGDAVTIVD